MASNPEAAKTKKARLNPLIEAGLISLVNSYLRRSELWFFEVWGPSVYSIFQRGLLKY